MSDLVHLILLIVLLGLSVYMIVWGARKILGGRSGESKKRDSPLLLGVTIAATGTMLCLYLARGARPGFALLFLPMVVVILRFAWVPVRPFTQADAVQSFANDRGKCGQCEYDLTGNTTGVCPECGWKIPQGELLAEDLDWVAWWRQWEIRYLREWLWHLTSYIGLSLLLLAQIGDTRLISSKRPW
jgi:hypothetical protein